MNVKKLFDKPKVIGVVANVNTGKSNLIYHLLNELENIGKFKLCTYGLRTKLKNARLLHSVNEMEKIKNSILIVDEMFSLFDLDNRKVKSQIENTLRLINHNNNVLMLCGVGENFKKFLSSKLDVIIYKKIDFEDLINGCRVKNVIKNYKGPEAGTTLLNLGIDEALIFDGESYDKIHVPYMKEYDSKAKNVEIVQKSIPKSVPKNVQKK